MIFLIKFICSLLFLSIFSSCSSKDDSFLNEDALILSHDGAEREYLLHTPENYDSSISHPMEYSKNLKINLLIAFYRDNQLPRHSFRNHDHPISLGKGNLD